MALSMIMTDCRETEAHGILDQEILGQGEVSYLSPPLTQARKVLTGS